MSSLFEETEREVTLFLVWPLDQLGQVVDKDVTTKQTAVTFTNGLEGAGYRGSYFSLFLGWRDQSLKYKTG